MGLTKYVSIWEKENKWDDIRLIVGQFNTILLFIGIVSMSFILLFAKDISFYLFQDQQYYLLIVYVSFSLPLSLVNPILDSIIRGLKRFGHFARISVFISIISLISTLVLVYFYKVEGIIISFTISSILGFITYYFYFQKTSLLKLTNFFSLNFRYTEKFRIIIKIGIAALIVGLADQVSQLTVRSVIIKSFGINYNGLYQSIYSISINYFSVLFLSLGIYLLPILSELKESKLVNIEINSMLRLAFILIVPLIISIFVFKNYLILLFYSKDFLQTTNLMFFALLGDYFKAFSWIIGSWLVPLSRVKTWVTISLIYYFNFPLLFIVLLNFSNFGLKSVVISYFISYVIHSVINLYFIVKYNGFVFSSENKKLFPFSFLFILIAFLLTEYNLTFGYILILPFILIWVKLAVSRNEIEQGLSLVKNKIFKHSG